MAHLAEEFRLRRHRQSRFVERVIELVVAVAQFLQAGFQFALGPPGALDGIVLVGDVRTGPAITHKFAAGVVVDRNAA